MKQPALRRYRRNYRNISIREYDDEYALYRDYTKFHLNYGNLKPQKNKLNKVYKLGYCETRKKIEKE